MGFVKEPRGGLKVELDITPDNWYRAQHYEDIFAKAAQAAIHSTSTTWAVTISVDSLKLIAWCPADGDLTKMAELQHKAKACVTELIERHDRRDDPPHPTPQVVPA